MNKWMQKAIDNGTPEFKRYAEVIIESMPEVTLPVLREMFKYNVTVREYRDHMDRVEGRIK
jgi:hypothetical protein